MAIVDGELGFESAFADDDEAIVGVGGGGEDVGHEEVCLEDGDGLGGCVEAKAVDDGKDNFNTVEFYGDTVCYASQCVGQMDGVAPSKGDEALPATGIFFA